MVKKILLAEPRGFCFGVKNALKIVEEAISKYPNSPIYVYNEIVHNKTIVNDLKEKGIIFTREITDIPQAAVVIISAHGAPPAIKKEIELKNLILMDATCPLVKKVHDEVNKYSSLGYHIIYIGSKNHDEARGVIAENPGNISVIGNEEDIEKIKPSEQKYMVLTQTTLNMFEVAELFKKIKNKLPNVHFPEKKDLCYATAERQNTVKELAPQCELFLVLGSENSSNSRKLRDIAAEHCPAYLIDNYHEISPDWLTNVNTIGITSGASAPEFLVEELILYLNKQGFSL